MDYSKLVEASQASDLNYAKWYASLPIEDKNRLFLSGFNFVADKIAFDIKAVSYHPGKYELIWKFIEVTQKGEYPEETFAFIREQMQKRIEQEWKQRFSMMKNALGWTYEQMAQYMGASSGASLKASISRKVPAFAKLAICVYEQMSTATDSTNK